MEVGTDDLVENSRIGSDIPFSWAFKWRGDLACGQFPRGLLALGKGRVPDGIPDFQTSLLSGASSNFSRAWNNFFQSLSLYKPQFLSSVTVLYPLSP